MLIYIDENTHTINTEPAFVASKEAGPELNAEKTKREFISRPQYAGKNNNNNNNNNNNQNFWKCGKTETLGSDTNKRKLQMMEKLKADWAQGMPATSRYGILRLRVLCLNT